MAVRRLQWYVTRFSSDWSRIRTQVTQVLASGPSVEAARFCLDAAFIRLWDAWSYRCRMLVISSAEGSAAAPTGQPLRRGASVPPMLVLRGVWGRKPMGQSWEPRWGAPDQAVRAARLLSVPNEPQIAAGLLLHAAPEQLRVVRNAVAHSLPNTWAEYRKLEGQLTDERLHSPSLLGVERDPSSKRFYIDVWGDQLLISLREAAR